mmetsp:Transcript_1416/g.2993  ORF Transcript_1416/g.2993 Transcript_1416/m.2993 type:complete len:575 (+) Transcript_1416:133-1857(+)
MRAGFLASLAAVASGRALRTAHKDVDVDDESAARAEVWIAVHPSADTTYFYNPVRGKSVWHLPHGAVASAVQVAARRQAPEGDAAPEETAEETTTAAPAEGAAEASDAPAANETAAAPATEANATAANATGTNGTAANGTEPETEKAGTTPYPTIVPLEKRKSCVPHCGWNCTKPVCEQNCKPECGVPSCETRCPKTSDPKAFEGCKMDCGEPSCAMFCPPDPCAGRKTLDCETPKCVTRCKEPSCTLNCNSASSMGCKTVCPTPQCQWKCTRPKDCPKPTCRMLCEMPPQCVKGDHLVVPPPESGMERIGRAAAASRAENKWTVEHWGRCPTACGVGHQTRRVECAAGKDKEEYCKEPKPRSERVCEEYKGCDYDVSSWSSCSSRCASGHKTRDVTCKGPKCLGERPESNTTCNGHADTCSQCRVTVWGGRAFDGWEHSFGPGEYSSVDLEYKGLKCDDVSSLEVVGDYCEMTVYQFGDFNKLHKGWTAEFKMGKYDVHDLEAQGARNNDISSFKIVRKVPEKPHRHAHEKHVKQHQNSTPAWQKALTPERSHSGVAGTAVVAAAAAVVLTLL